MAEPFVLRPGSLTLADMRAVMDGGPAVALDPDCWAAVEAAAALVRELAAGDERVYGINTGFGSLARTSIPESDIRELQRRLVLSHCVGTGPPLSERVVREAMQTAVQQLIDHTSNLLVAGLAEGGVPSHPASPER